jgi:hypothetical protein
MFLSLKRQGGIPCLLVITACSYLSTTGHSGGAIPPSGPHSGKDILAHEEVAGSEEGKKCLELLGCERSLRLVATLAANDEIGQAMIAAATCRMWSREKLFTQRATPQ